jgi:hypothetical protein
VGGYSWKRKIRVCLREGRSEACVGMICDSEGRSFFLSFIFFPKCMFERRNLALAYETWACKLR